MGYYLGTMRRVYRWCVLLVWAVAGPCMAQTDSTVTAIDSTEREHEWADKEYSQEKKIYNGLLLSALVNPAYAGYDRQLVVQYGAQIANTAQLAPISEQSGPAFWEQTATVDFAFAGKRRNMGVNVGYGGGRWWKSDFHRIFWSHSFRFRAGHHHFIFGLGYEYRMMTTDLSNRVFGDMTDPRYGLIYPTQEGSVYQRETWKNSSMAIMAGFIYTYKRVMFSYAFRMGPNSYEPSLGVSSTHDTHSFHAAYHIRARPLFTITPHLTVVYRSFDPIMPVQVNPGMMCTVKDHVYLGLSSPFLDRLQLDLGVQLFGGFRLSANAALYYLKKSHDVNGLAQAGGSLRYIIPTWKD